MQKVQIKKWGNSSAIRIPKNILDSMNLGTDSELEISVDKENKSITLVEDNGLTPYQKLMKKGKENQKRKTFVWDRLEEENMLPD